MARKTLTKAQTKEHGKLYAARDAAIAAVWACEGLGNMGLRDAITAAPQQVRNAYLQACSLLIEFERRMVDEGRAWFASFGMFTPY